MRSIAPLVGLFLLILFSLSVLAQDDASVELTITPADQCGTPLSSFWVTASDSCVGKPFGFVCNGGMSPLVTPPEVSNSISPTGALVETGVIQSLRTSQIQPNGEAGGIAWLRVAEPDTLVQYSAMLVGDVEVTNVTPENFPPWQAITVKTTDPTERCENAPFSALVVQSLPNQSARVVINGVSLDLNGTAVIHTTDTATEFMNINGAMEIIATGNRRSLAAGQEVTVDYNPDDLSRPGAIPSDVVSFDRERVDNLPVLLFDRPITVPQAGFATTLGPVNMRTAPNLDAAVLVQAPVGERLTVLGKNPAGDWYHVQRSNGSTGWMFAELLQGASGEIADTYMETPEPLQRLGELGTKARVIAPSGTTVRSAPDVGFSPLTSIEFGRELTLVARSPYSPWIKVDIGGGSIGWVALIAVETQAIVDSLPIDFDVPPPPEPTRIPGSFGNAFPDPNCYPNCGN